MQAQAVNHLKQSKQAGVALITTLLITGIVAIVASELTTNRHRITERTIQLIASDQGLISVWSIENFVKIVLAEDSRESTADFPGEDWSINATIPVDNGLISGHLSDETAKFNINNLLVHDAKNQFDPTYQLNSTTANRLLNLFRNLNIDNPEELTSAIIDYLDGNTEVYRGIKPFRGAEDDYYARLNPAYRTANRSLFDLSELKLVRGMNAEIYRKIEPHLTALPEATAVNANFASAHTLRMLSPQITLELANEIVKRQNKQEAFRSYNSLINFMQSYTGNNSLAKELPKSVINTQSGYIRLTMQANLAGSITNSVSILKRQGQNALVVRRTFGR